MGVNSDGSINSYIVTVEDAGKHIELSILPVSDIGPTQGHVMTSAVVGPAINPLAGPIVTSESPEWIGAPTINVSAYTIKSATYQLDINGGYSGDNSRYEYHVDDTLVTAGTITTPGVIPAVTIPRNNTPGIVYRTLIPVNGKGIVGSSSRTAIGYVVDNSIAPTLTSLAIKDKDKAWAPGDILTATVDVNFNGNPPVDSSQYLWRYYKADDNNQKVNDVINYGSTVASPGTIPPRVLSNADAGSVIELLYRPRLLGGLSSATVGFDSLSNPVAGSAPDISNAGALPTIENIRPQDYRANTNSTITYTLNTNGGYYRDVSEYSYRIVGADGSVLMPEPNKRI
ncbi:hypothetical protein [Aeromonas jandaei]|uniref:hypothetical protein n=1 Tax=Aeromonas jandaei TaxID=650 RepID=UPI003EC532CC